MYNAPAYIRLLTNFTALINCMKVRVYGGWKGIRMCISFVYLQMTCFGCSTYGVSGAKWHYAARAAVQTMMGSFGGGCVGLGYSMFLRDGRLDIMDLINSILGSLVSITGIWRAVVGTDFLLGQSPPTYLMDSLFQSCPEGLSHDSRSNWREVRI
jgi:hypothetical protein